MKNAFEGGRRRQGEGRRVRSQTASASGRAIAFRGAGGCAYIPLTGRLKLYANGTVRPLKKIRFRFADAPVLSFAACGPAARSAPRRPPRRPRDPRAATPRRRAARAGAVGRLNVIRLYRSVSSRNNDILTALRRARLSRGGTAVRTCSGTGVRPCVRPARRTAARSGGGRSRSVLRDADGGVVDHGTRRPLTFRSVVSQQPQHSHAGLQGSCPAHVSTS